MRLQYNTWSYCGTGVNNRRSISVVRKACTSIRFPLRSPTLHFQAPLQSSPWLTYAGPCVGQCFWTVSQNLQIPWSVGDEALFLGVLVFAQMYDAQMYIIVVGFTVWELRLEWILHRKMVPEYRGSNHPCGPGPGIGPWSSVTGLPFPAFCILVSGLDTTWASESPSMETQEWLWFPISINKNLFP